MVVTFMAVGEDIGTERVEDELLRCFMTLQVMRDLLLRCSTIYIVQYESDGEC